MEVALSTEDCTGVCFDLQRYAIHDGPGIRTTVFLKGCPLFCSWCHNPEGRRPEPEIHLFTERCIRCGSCLEVCPIRTATAPVSLPMADRPGCTHCGCCADACLSDARRLVGRTTTVHELLDEIERDRPFYEESGGGVTFSGGEPLLQIAFLLECLRACRRRRIHTAVDTCGYTSREQILDVAGQTDLFLYDLKILDEHRHYNETGVPLAPILENLRALDGAGAEILVRVPILPGINDDADNIDAIGALLSSLVRTRCVHLLPYHPMASGKYQRMGVASPPARLPRPSAEQIGEIARHLEEYNLRVIIGG